MYAIEMAWSTFRHPPLINLLTGNGFLEQTDCNQGRRG